MALIKPNRSRILKEAALRSLSSGELIPGLPLRSSQAGGLQGYHDFLENTSDEFERRHGYADMATASGKTGMFSLIGRHAFRVAQEKGIGDTFRTLIVEPSVFLLKQTYDAFVRIAPELKDAIGIYGGDDRDLSRPFTIISYDSWMALLESGKLQGADIDLNINDESHKGLSQRRQTLINQVLTDTHHLGFTASSQYDRDKSMELTHRNRFYHLSLKDAIEGNAAGGMGLADYVHVQYGVMRLMPKDMKRKKDVDLDNIDFSALKRVEWSRLVTHAYREGMDGISGQPLSDKVAIFFASNTTHADFVAEMLNNDPVLQQKAKAAGFKGVAVPIHTVGYSSSEQQRRMDAFQNGEYMAAVGDKKFQAGFDYPRVKFIASYPGSSLVDAVQEMGRATRQYIDSATGEEQGAVIFETVPYIGDADPQADAVAQKKALRNLVTARDVLGGETLVLRKGRNPSRKLPVKGPGTVRIPLSSGATAEVFMTYEETLTVSRQIDAASEPNRNALSEALVVQWIAATKEKIGRLPSSADKIVWTSDGNGGFEIVDTENWQSIDYAFRNKFRIQPNEDGSAPAKSLPDLKRKYGLVDDRLLSEEQIVEWIRTTQKVTGKLPSVETAEVWTQSPEGGVDLVEGETWRMVNESLARGHRGLIDKNGARIASSLADLKRKHNLVDDRTLTEAQVVEWIVATKEKTGSYPTSGDIEVWSQSASGKFELVENETWRAINSAFVYKNRGLINPDGTPIAASLAELKNKHGLNDSAVLTEQQIIAWLNATKDKTGKLPSTADKIVWAKMPNNRFEVVEGINWNSIDRSLALGLQGLANADGSPVASSLAEFKKKHGFVPGYGNLSEQTIIDWIKATQEKTGKLPVSSDPDVWRRLAGGGFEIVRNETWSSINSALNKKERGLVNEDGSAIAGSLSQLKAKHGFVAVKQALSEQEIVDWIKATYEKTAKYPSAADETVYRKTLDGQFEIVANESWTAIDIVLKKRQRGLFNADKSAVAENLADLKQKHGFVTDKTLSEQKIIEWMLATKEVTGKIPSGKDPVVYEKTSSGISVVEGENWNAINIALYKKTRGLVNPDGSAVAKSLSDLKKKHGLDEPSTRWQPKVAPPSSQEEPVAQTQATDVAESARKTVNDLFAQLSGDLVDRVAAAVVLRLQGQQPVVTPINNDTPPHTQPMVVEATPIPTQVETKTETTEKPPESITPPASTSEPVSVAIHPVSASVAAQEDRNVKFAAFTSPLFAKPDARGDSMLSLLMNADRAFFYNDPIGLKGNLRKFVEVWSSPGSLDTYQLPVGSCSNASGLSRPR